MKAARKKAKKGQQQLNIEVEGVSLGGGHGHEEGVEEWDFEPPTDLSPRSKAAFARLALRKAAAARKKKKKRKKKKEEEKISRKKRRKRKRRRKKKKR